MSLAMPDACLLDVSNANPDTASNNVIGIETTNTKMQSHAIENQTMRIIPDSQIDGCVADTWDALVFPRIHF